ncbi:hypothetical protein L249_7410 [Ophiocordyceps polyrhachis-furcata BCC 54312]|uniref:Uncharacterized protein n=1 Tax=Ophiocordyceps polyrhachis-furcata BCC 54312 TaxID=1330021 RepID=A0A367LA94_9HYPO|nr:hypothetical protein L249_7410 [Ophiocordyceps polyrhachis-furcata BCC 54312]
MSDALGQPDALTPLAKQALEHSGALLKSAAAAAAAKIANSVVFNCIVKSFVGQSGVWIEGKVLAHQRRAKPAATRAFYAYRPSAHTVPDIGQVPMTPLQINSSPQEPCLHDADCAKL